MDVLCLQTKTILQHFERHVLRSHERGSRHKPLQHSTGVKAKNLVDNRYYAIKKLENNDQKIQAEGFPITALRGMVFCLIKK